MCEYAARCKEYFKTLHLADVYFDEAHNMCYCHHCHTTRGDNASYQRGTPPKTYPIPVGWYRFALKIPANMRERNVSSDWHRAYHGTELNKLQSILNVGKIVPTGRRVVGGAQLTERPGHIQDSANVRSLGINTKMTYLSPSIRYSGDDVYASRTTVKTSGKRYSARYVFQVYVKPGSYLVKAETIGAGSRCIDPEIPNSQMEWITDLEGGHVLTGLLIQLT